MNEYQYATEDANKALKYAATCPADTNREAAALRGIGYALLALAEAAHQIAVALEPPKVTGRSQVIATADGGTVTGVKQSIG